MDDAGCHPEHLQGLNWNLTVILLNGEDPFSVADECKVLGDLISTTMSTHEACRSFV